MGGERRLSRQRPAVLSRDARGDVSTAAKLSGRCEEKDLSPAQTARLRT